MTNQRASAVLEAIKTEEGRKREEEKLDQYVIEWYQMDNVADSARKSSLQKEIILLGYCIFNITDKERNEKGYDNPVYDSELFALLESALKNYDPEKGSYSHYISRARSLRMKTAYKKTGADKEVSIYGNSDSDEENGGLIDTLADNYDSNNPSIDGIDYAQRMENLGECIMNILINKSPEKPVVKWFRIFFTENITDLVNVDSLYRVKLEFRHERDIFNIINRDYMNFYTRDVCNTIKDVAITKLKKYGEIMEIVQPEKAERTIELPLRDNPDVSLAFLKKCNGEESSKSNRSNFLDKYKKAFMGDFT